MVVIQIAAEKGEAYAAELSAMVLPKHGFKIHYIETSAKANINVDNAFRLLAHMVFIGICWFCNQRVYSSKREGSGIGKELLIENRLTTLSYSLQ